MKEYNLNGHSLVVVENVPKDAKPYIIPEASGKPYCCLMAERGVIIDELSGQYELLGRAGELSEEQWEKMCEFWTSDAEGQIMNWTQWKNYYNPSSKNDYDLLTALESGHSWLRVNNINKKDLLIIKK